MFICRSSDYCKLTTTLSQVDFNSNHLKEHTAGVLLSFDDMTNYTLFRLSNLSLSDLTFDPQDTQILARHRIWPFFFWITFVVGLCGNSLVVYVICRMKQLRTVTNMYLLNLAIVDILYLIDTIPNTSYGWTDYWPFGEFMCKYTILLNIFDHASTYWRLANFTGQLI